jgi:FHS family glucose/mannose:H+ symporter-like MFS transporter
MEWGVGVWFPSYWKETPLASMVPPAASVSLFRLTFAIGRVYAFKVADKWGFRRFLSVSMAATLVLVCVWFFFREPLFALCTVALLGFVIAGQYPTIVALASRKFPASSGHVASFLSIFTMLGSTLFPAGVGFWADASGIFAMVTAELILAVSMFAFAIMMFAADRRQENL